MENTVSITEVINQIIKTIGLIAPIAAAATFGLTEVLKKFNIPDRWTGLAAVVVGFFITIFLFKILTNLWFSPLSILTGILVGLGTPGTYSVLKNTFESKQ